MDTEDVIATIREVERLSYYAAPVHNTPTDLDPVVYAQLAHAWALVAVAKAIAIHADRLPPA